MAAHLRAVHHPKCIQCNKMATVRLWNTFNSPLSFFCDRHGDQMLEKKLAEDREAFARNVER